MARANRNAAIDGLRALAVWSVFLFHIRPTSLPGGFVGVDVFFVISGYVVCRSLLALPRGSLTQLLTSFYFRRLMRIYPPLLACLITTGVMARMFIPPSSLAGNSDRTGLFAFWGLSNYELAADHDTYFGVMTDFNPYVHTWSLAVEEQFYVVFPLLFFLARQSAGMRNTVTRSIARWLMPAMVLTSLCTSMWQSRFSIDSAFFLLPSRFWELGAGVLLSFLHDTKSLLPRTNRQAFLLAASGLGLIGMSMRFVTNVGFPFPGAIAPVAGSVLLICGVALESSRHPIKQLLEHPICVYFGRISYSLYLWHWPVIVLLRWTYGTESLSAAWFAVSVTTILAMLSYHLIEIPCQWAGRFGGGEFSVSLSLPENDGNQPVFSWFVSSKLMVIVIGLGGIFVTQKLFDRVVKSNRLALSVTTRKTAGFNSWRDVDPQFLSRLEPSRRLFIIGDSHAGSYAPMAKMFSQEFGGSKVVIRTLGGANFATLLRRRRAEDQRFVEAALAELRHAANRGDAVLLSSLRVERLCDQWKAFDLREVLQRRDSAAAEEERLAAVEEGVELIAELQAMGLEVIIEAPKPILPSPAFRCRDWFNRSNPIGDGGLAISRSFLLGHRAPAMRSIAEVCRRLPATHVWDPFWVLCPGEVFEGMEGERAIFFDGDHLAPYGNQKLYSSLRDFVLRIWGESRIAGRER